MPREINAYLADILLAIDEINNFVEGLDFTSYFGNRVVRRAVERDFEIIGEALKRCEELYPGSTDSLPEVSNFVRFRDRLAHAYFKTDQQIVWDSIVDDLPPLQKAVNSLMRDTSLPNREDPFSGD